MYVRANFAPQRYLFHSAYTKIRGARKTSRKAIINPVTPSNIIPNIGYPISYANFIVKRVMADQITNTTNSIFNDNGIGFQPFESIMHN